MATELAKAYVQIVPSAQGIKNSITEELGGEADSAGKSVGSKLVSAIKGVITAAAIGKFLGTALTEGAALEQSIGGIETLFKDSADTIKEYAANAYQTAGVSANTYMEQVTSFSAALISSLGGDTAAAAEVADMAITDMADNANKMGTSIEDIQNAYQGFAKQNYTMLDNLKLGYGGTKEEMERLLEDAEALSGVEYDIDNLSDVYNAIHVIQEELGITGTTAQEAAETLSGSFSSLKAAFQNVMGEITLGMDIGPSLSALASTLVTFLVGNLLPALWNIISALPGALVTFIAELGPQLLTALSGLISEIASGLSSPAEMLEAANNMVNQLKTGIETQLPVMLQEGVNMLLSLVNGMLQSLPELISGAGQIGSNFIDAIGSALPTILTQGEELLLGLVDGIVNNLPQIVSAATEAVSSMVSAISSNLPSVLQSGAKMLLKLAEGIINNLPQIASAGAQAIVKLVSSIASNLPQILQSGITIIGKLAAGLIQAIPTLVSKIPQIISSIKDAFTSVDWLSIGKNIISGIANGLKNAGSALWDAVKGVLGSFKDKVLSFFGISSPAKWGIYVGEMIDAGLAGGLEDGENSIAKAVKDVQDTIASPLTYDTAYSLNAVGTSTSTADNGLLAKIGDLVSAIESNSGKSEEIVLKIKDRELARAEKKMGVVFA